jgi:hypothetical protein
MDAARRLTQEDIDAVHARVTNFLREGDITPSVDAFTNGIVEACRMHGYLLVLGGDVGRKHQFYDEAAAVVMRPLLYTKEYKYVDKTSHNQTPADIPVGPERISKQYEQWLSEF